MDRRLDDLHHLLNQTGAFNEIFVRDECMQVPLYHGTSSIMLDSIKKHGLGGYDIIFGPPGGKSFFDEVLCISEMSEKLQSDSDIYCLADYISEITLKKIKGQTSGEGYNFRHGSVYFALSYDHAKKYCRSYGSELISEAMRWFEKLSLDDQEKLRHKYHLLFEFLDKAKTAYPVILEIRKMSVNMLASEHGEKIQDQLARLESCWNRMLQEIKDTINRNYDFRRGWDDDDAIDNFCDMMRDEWIQKEIEAQKRLFYSCCELESFELLPGNIIPFNACVIHNLNQAALYDIS